MVKPDPKHDYYADLRIPHYSLAEDIKKAFHKLAIEYHPDHNLGKEEKVVPIFQAIQTAYEALRDPHQRYEYDIERRRMDYSGTKPSSSYTTFTPFNRPPSAHTQSQNLYSAPPRAPPPRKWDRPPNNNVFQSERTGRPSPAQTASYTATASREYTPYKQTQFNPNARRPQPPSSSASQPRPSTSVDADGRASAWKAFRGAGASSAKLDTRRQSQPFQPQPKPAIGRSFTTPRRPGFDPKSPTEIFEPAAPRSSSYVFLNQRNNRSDNFESNDSPNNASNDATLPTSPRPRARSASPPREKIRLESQNLNANSNSRPDPSLNPNPNKPSSTNTQPSSLNSSASTTSSAMSGIPLDEAATQAFPQTKPQSPQSLADEGAKPYIFQPTAWEKPKVEATNVFNPPPPWKDFFQSSETIPRNRRVSPSRPAAALRTARPFASKLTTAPPPAIHKSTTVNSSATARHHNAASARFTSRPTPQYDWKGNYYPPIFTFPPPADHSATNPTPILNKPRTAYKDDIDSSKNEGLSFDAPIVVSDDDDDIMDLDTPPLATTPDNNTNNHNRTARPVKQPVSRSDWQSRKARPVNSAATSTSNPALNAASPASISFLPQTPLQSTFSARNPGAATLGSFNQSPHYEPSPATGAAANTPLSFNMNKMKDNLDLGGAGVDSMGDVMNSLPFQSAPSPHCLSELFKLELPHPPIGPEVPARLTAKEWKTLVQRFSVYMGRWYEFEDKILSHFRARHYDSQKFGKGSPDIAATRLIEAHGEPQTGGLGMYLHYLKQDERVTYWWSSAREMHLKSVEDFALMKKQIQRKGFD